MNESYFVRRLMEELKAAERSGNEQERAAHLRGCYLLCTLLGLNLGEGDRRVGRKLRLVRAIRQRRSARPT